MIIDPRFNGPPGTGNGGYTAGLVAAHLATPDGVPALVTLRLPPPLGTSLRVQATAEGVKVYDGQRLVAEAEPDRQPASEPVSPVRYPQAEAAAATYPGFADHPFPTCYVCGPERPSGDGLRIFPGPVPGGRSPGPATAAPWRVPDDVTEATVWAALDCPGGWTIIGPGRPYVLGRMAALVHTVPPPGTECVVVGELVSAQGRKAQVRTAVYPRDPSGAPPLATAHATWLTAPTAA